MSDTVHATDPRPEDRLSVFFDGSCPLCTREIDFYRRRPGAQAVEWVDVSAVEGDAVAPGLTREAAMARFHVRRGDGALISGAAAFAELWRALPGFRLIGRIATVWPLTPLLELAYCAFLPVRPRLQRLFSGRKRESGCAPCAEIGAGERGRATPHGGDLR